jgi:hypothetical protein
MFMASLPAIGPALVMPGHGNLHRLRKLICAAGHPRLSASTAKQDVDGRDKPGHDGAGPIEFIRLPLSRDDLIIQGENAATFC